MELVSKIGSYDFLAEPFHCDFANRLFMGHLGNHLLNAADFHGNDRGYGMHYLNPNHKTWVLSRLAIEMSEMPKAYDRFTVDTWIDGAMRYFTSRNFAIRGQNGKVYGYGRSIWAMIDTDSRQPTDILAIHDGLVMSYVDTEKPCPIEKSSRVKMDSGAEFMRTIDTYYSDVDVNGHINSVKYIEHILDLFDIDFYGQHHLKRFEVAYVAESHQGDQLNFYRQMTGESEYCVRITKGIKNTDNEAEVVRSKMIFVKD